jgi:hypothetical protein
VIPNTSPLDFLLAYAIVFLAGILTMITLRKYTERIRGSIQRA